MKKNWFFSIFLLTLVTNSFAGFIEDDENIADSVGDVSTKSVQKMALVDKNHILSLKVNFHYFYNKTHSIELNETSSFLDIIHFFQDHQPLVFIIHGWQAAYTENNWLGRLKNKIHNTEPNTNVVIVDWRYFSGHFYYMTAAEHTKTVAEVMFRMVRFLYERDLITEDQITCIGHSLGSHVAGFFGKRTQTIGIKIKQIIALDPAGLTFDVEDPSKRLDENDAKLVIVYHTNMGAYALNGLGLARKVGHIDLFLNGGARQPGCTKIVEGYTHDNTFVCNDESCDLGAIFPPKEVPIEDEGSLSGEDIQDSQNNGVIETTTMATLTTTPAPSLSSSLLGFFTKLYKSSVKSLGYLFCHHVRCTRLFEISFNGKCQPVAYQCESYKKFLRGQCASCGQGEKCILLGFDMLRSYNLVPKEKHSFFIDTTDSFPFCLNHYQVLIELNKLSDNSSRTIELELDDRSGVIRTFEFQGYFESGKTYKFLLKTNNLGNVALGKAKYKDSMFRSTPNLIVDKVEINFMSNIDALVRERYSSHLCFDGNLNSFTLLINCLQNSIEGLV